MAAAPEQEEQRFCFLFSDQELLAAGTTTLSSRVRKSDEGALREFVLSRDVEEDKVPDRRSLNSWALSLLKAFKAKAVQARLESMYDEASQTELGKELYNAVAARNMERFNELLEAGVGCNYRMKSGDTPLMKACQLGASGMIRRLIEAGADVRAESLSGETALYWACSCRMYANVQTEMRDVVVSLLDAGSDPNKADARNKQTALMCAAMNNCFEVVRVLVEAGANPTLQNRFKKTAIELTRNEEIIAYLEPICDVMDTDARVAFLLGTRPGAGAQSSVKRAYWDSDMCERWLLPVIFSLVGKSSRNATVKREALTPQDAVRENWAEFVMQIMRVAVDGAVAQQPGATGPGGVWEG